MAARVAAVVIALVFTAWAGPRLSRPPRGADPRAGIAAPQRLTLWQRQVLDEVARQTHAGIRYDAAYVAGGEPPADRGVCTDVVVRALRAGGVDLHRAITEDVRANPAAYGIRRPDPAIDHRRCRNLVTYLRRHALSLPTERGRADWRPADIVFWSTAGNGNVDHVGVIASGRDAEGLPTFVHHWPGRPVAEDGGVYAWKVMHHFRWLARGARMAHGHGQRPSAASAEQRRNAR